MNKIIILIVFALVISITIPSAFAEFVTVSLIATDGRHARTNSDQSTACPTTASSLFDTTRVEAFLTRSDTSGFCHRGAFEFDISTIPSDATVVSTVFRYDLFDGSTSRTCDWTELNTRPSTATAQQLWDDVGDGTVFISNDSSCVTSGDNKSVDLGGDANLDVEAQRTLGWWGLGIKFNNEVRDPSNHSILIENESQGGAVPKPTLDVTYLPADTTAPVISTTISEPIPIPETELPFPLILKNVTGGGSTVGQNDQTANNNEANFAFVNPVIPTGAKVHAITLRNIGAVSSTVLGWYADGINLSQDLGIEISQLNDFANPEEIQWKLVPPVIKTATPSFAWISNQTTSWLAIAGSNTKFDSNEFFAILPNSLTNDGLKGLNLNQTITYQEVENFGAFDPLEFVNCIDDIDGVITNKVTSVGTVDTSIPKGYTITYTCTDRASNQSQLEVLYIIKRQPTSGISVSTTQQPVGGVQDIPTISDIPTLSLVPTEPIEQPPTRTLDEIFDLFSLLFEEVEPTPTLEVVPESVTEIPPPLSQPPTPTEVRPSFIESIQNFFAGLFG